MALLLLDHDYAAALAVFAFAGANSSTLPTVFSPSVTASIRALAPGSIRRPENLLMLASFLALTFIAVTPPWLTVLVLARDAAIVAAVLLAKYLGWPLRVQPTPGQDQHRGAGGRCGSHAGDVGHSYRCAAAGQCRRHRHGGVHAGLVVAAEDIHRGAPSPSGTAARPDPMASQLNLCPGNEFRARPRRFHRGRGQSRAGCLHRHLAQLAGPRRPSWSLRFGQIPPGLSMGGSRKRQDTFRRGAQSRNYRPA